MIKHTNELIHSSSPYLLQHAHNPVHWVEWSEEAFLRAKKEGKLVLISVGYSACHWCHVMEQESFMDVDVAELMNQHLVCIKVDREERPDVDQIYMTAVQLMTQHGGWPLNCFALPDGRPIYGGTYFPKENWKKIIHNLWEVYQNNPEKVEEYAQHLKDGIAQTELIEKRPLIQKINPSELIELVQLWKQNFDFEHGGNNGAPKFMMPNNLEFLLRFGKQYKDTTCLNHVHKTLEKMAFGGIYDQIGGGFSRYAVDEIWKIPHFEKMLYDNAQLLSVYAQAYQHKKSDVYKQIIEQTIAWANREMRHEDKGYYAALDADSEGVEGKFYTWTKEELDAVLEIDEEWIKDFYSVNSSGHWENERYILLRSLSLQDWCEKNGFPHEEYQEKLELIHQKLTALRNQRTRPGLDDKQLTSWNALMVKGLIDAGLALQNRTYIEEAKKTACWIKDFQYNAATGQLYRTRKGNTSKINGFLEDYAHVIQAFIALFEVTFEKQWIDFAKKLTDFAILHFYDETSKMFFFTNEDTDLIVRNIEINDNVIPSSNSVMANNLFKMSKIFHAISYQEKAQQMLSNIYYKMSSYGSAYSNWGILTMSFATPYFEVVISGKDASNKRFKIGQHYVPNVVFIGGEDANTPFLTNKVFTEESTIYVCENFTCRTPTQSIEEVINQII